MYHGERFNSFTHLVGAALALAALVVLVVFASLQGLHQVKLIEATIFICVARRLNRKTD